MSEFDQDPSANTAGFRAFVERGEEDSAPRRFRVSPAVLAIAGIAIVAIILIVTMA